MIYLSHDTKDRSMYDTFWIWFKREFPNSSFKTPKILKNNDILLRHSVLGFLPIEGKQMALCWDFGLEIRDNVGSTLFEHCIAETENAARYATYRTVTTEHMKRVYEKYGSVEVIPVGIDTDLYRPLNNKKTLRNKYKLPKDKRIGIWIGSYSPEWGISKFFEYASQHPEIEWIIVWESKAEKLRISNVHSYTRKKQVEVCELLNAADFFLSTSQIKTYCISEWEAMATNIPFVVYGNVEREFSPSNNPRQDVFRAGWDRKSVKQKWMKLFRQKGVTW